MRAIGTRAVVRRLLWMAAAFITLSTGTSAAQVSQEFLGTFVIPPEQQGDPLSCGRDNNDGAVEISNRSVGYSEHQCDVSAFRSLKSGPRSADVLLDCAGEGQRWRTRQIWNVQRVESRMMLVATTLQISKAQPAGKRRGHGKMQDEVRVTVYTKCPAARQQ